MPVIRNNSISRAAYGIFCDGYLARLTPLIEGNTITDCGGAGILVYKSSPTIDGNVIMYCIYWGLEFNDGGGNCTRNVIAYNGHISELDAGGVWAGSNTYGETPSLNAAGDPEMANDIYNNIGVQACAVTNVGLNEMHAVANYWGRVCPDCTSTFKGHIWYWPWVDSTHTTLVWNCSQGVEPTTWGSIKALFR